MIEAIDNATLPGAPDFPQRLGHPKPLWMLFMTEFWERFAFYSVSWALALYIVQQFYHGNSSGQAWASGIFGAYTALIYGTCLFGGGVADRVIGYQRTILMGALVMAAGLFVLALLDLDFAAKIAGVVACLLALPAIWMLPRQKQTESRSQREQFLHRARSGKSVRQKSTRPINQRMSDVNAKADIEQSQ